MQGSDSDPSIFSFQFFKTLLIAVIIILTLTCVNSATNNIDYEVKQPVDNTLNKIQVEPFKVINKNSTHMTAIIDGKTKTLKKVSVPGIYGTNVAHRNSKYIVVTGAYCTCGKHNWKQAKTVVFENDVRFTKNSEPIPKIGTFRIDLNSKGVVDQEFNVYNPTGRYHSVDICFFCGGEKSEVGKSVNNFYIRQIV